MKGIKRQKQAKWKCNQEDLYNAEPGCKGIIVGAPGGGIKCTVCSGWFCF